MAGVLAPWWSYSWHSEPSGSRRRWICLEWKEETCLLYSNLLPVSSTALTRLGVTHHGQAAPDSELMLVLFFSSASKSGGVYLYTDIRQQKSCSTLTPRGVPHTLRKSEYIKFIISLCLIHASYTHTQTHTIYTPPTHTFTLPYTHIFPPHTLLPYTCTLPHLTHHTHIFSPQTHSYLTRMHINTSHTLLPHTNAYTFLPLTHTHTIFLTHAYSHFTHTSSLPHILAQTPTVGYYCCDWKQRKP